MAQDKDFVRKCVIIGAVWILVFGSAILLLQKGQVTLSNYEAIALKDCVKWCWQDFWGASGETIKSCNASRIIISCACFSQDAFNDTLAPIAVRNIRYNIPCSP